MDEVDEGNTYMLENSIIIFCFFKSSLRNKGQGIRNKGNGSIAELQHSARQGKTFLLGWVGGWLGGWVRKAENKAEAQYRWDLGLAKLGIMNTQ